MGTVTVTVKYGVLIRFECRDASFDDGDLSVATAEDDVISYRQRCDHVLA